MWGGGADGDMNHTFLTHSNLSDTLHGMPEIMKKVCDFFFLSFCLWRLKVTSAPRSHDLTERDLR